MFASDRGQHVAIDLGASGGRVAVGSVRNGKLHFEVVHSFPHGGIPVGTRLYWDHLGIWKEILDGLKKAGVERNVASVGVNSWGVDHVLLDDAGNVMDGMRHYRDPRTNGVMDSVLKAVSRDEIYTGTGIQFMSINTAYQLVATSRQSPSLLDRASKLLMVPDLMHYWLCGVPTSEMTDASTTQLFEPKARTWNQRLIERLGLPRHIFCDLVEPGSVLEKLSSDVSNQTGLGAAIVIAPGTHDTASAVAAVPAQDESGWAYISSGTWSLVGVETKSPVISPQTLDLNLTNEAGIDGTTRLLKNVMGLWLLQECRRVWGNPEFSVLYAEAAAAKSNGPIIDPDDSRFLQPSHDMAGMIYDFCTGTGQKGPSDRGEITRCILESLALKSADIIDRLALLTGQPINVVHVVGGGSQIDLLNQMIADACGRTVVAGPVEATLVGNLLVQARTMGRLESANIREVVRNSFDLRTIEPGSDELLAKKRLSGKIFAGSGT